MTQPEQPLTAGDALAVTGFTECRKTALTPISDITFPPGTVYQTPEGLRAEDEETRCAFDVQGGIYPIRESVFQASYEAALPVPALDAHARMLITFAADRLVHVHGDPENVDFIQSLRALAQAEGEPAPVRKALSVGARARLCDVDHDCDDCGVRWRVDHYCRYGSKLCGGHSRARAEGETR